MMECTDLFPPGILPYLAPSHHSSLPDASLHWRVQLHWRWEEEAVDGNACELNRQFVPSWIIRSVYFNWFLIPIADYLYSHSVTIENVTTDIEILDTSNCLVSVFLGYHLLHSTLMMCAQLVRTLILKSSHKVQYSSPFDIGSIYYTNIILTPAPC